jgi:DNA-binding beta-propeller fold protein YncE
MRNAWPQTIRVKGTQLDVDLYGNSYLLDSERNTLRLLDKAGTLNREVGGPGWLDGQFDRPSAVWARNGIDVFVADYGNHRIQRFDRSLNFVSSFSTHESSNPDERFGYPSGVALSRLGELFVCDTENGRIVKVDRFSAVERTFGGFGAGKGRLTAPRSLEIGPKDAIYVLDARRIAVFDAFGNYLRDLVPGLFTRPLGLFARSDLIVVLDAETLYFFDADERPEGTITLTTILPAGTDIRSFIMSADSLYFLTSGGLFKVSDPRPKRGGESNDSSPPEN